MSFSDEVVNDLEAEVYQSVEGLDLPFDEEDFRALGIAPERPTEARPGSDAKVVMLAARYAAGLPLWHNEDCYDHGPPESALKGQLPQK